jgi:hypothetical protein
MGSLAKPTHLEISIDEWQAAQEKVGAVNVRVSWRGARNDPILTAVFDGLPSSTLFVRGFPPTSILELVPIKLLDGRVELAPKSWKSLRFGKGRPIYELARGDFEAWSGGCSFLNEARLSEIGKLARRLVPGFDDYPVKAQIDFMGRTAKKVEAVRLSAGDLATHMEYATPHKKAVPPIKNLQAKIRAAVFSDMMNSTHRAGELLGVPNKDEGTRYENQLIRKRAELGRGLLYDYFGESEYAAIIECMQRYHRWWKWYGTIEDPKEQMYVLLAEAQGTSADHEKLRASADGFTEKLDEWVAVVERRLSAEKIYQRSDDPVAEENAQQLANQLWYQQKAIEETDARFKTALSLAELEAPTPSIA